MMSILKVVLKLLLALCFVTPCLAQSTTSVSENKQEEDEFRGILPEKFVKARPRKSGRAAPASSSYKRVTPAEESKTSTPRSSQYAQLGLTIWRLRKAVSADNGARILVQDDNGPTEWTPLRVAASTPFVAGDRVRMSIESSMEGYLYVIDREQYKDGTLGEPVQIFPTTRTRGGDNSVKPGSLIEIPAQDDRPNYFVLRTSRTDQVGELLTVIVTKQPIDSLPTGSKPLALSRDRVVEWEKTWGGLVEHFELDGGEGKTWTEAEQAVGADATRQLTQEDAPPQTVYRIAHEPPLPLLVNVRLLIRAVGLKP
jgi:hypothetical protein